MHHDPEVSLPCPFWGTFPERLPVPSAEEKRQRTGLVLPTGFAGLWLLLFCLWLIFNSSLALPILATGVVAATALAWIFTTRSTVWHYVRLTPHTIYHFLAYTGVFFVELVKANVNMLRYVYSPRIDIRPGIVKIRMRLRSPIGRLALANSIALTPGSLVMDVEDDALYVHWLDVRTTDIDEASEMIAGPFEKHLGRVFG